MALPPKTEPGSPPMSASNSRRNLNQMSISELVLFLRVAWKTEDYDRVEHILLDREAKIKAEIGSLQEKSEIERLRRIKAEEELKKREEQCEKGKKAQERYETLMKDVKRNGLHDRSTIDELRSKNKELEYENHKLRELKQNLEGDGNVIDQLRKRFSELEIEKVRLEGEKKKNVATIDELQRKLVDERIKADAKFVELLCRVEKLEEDAKVLMSVNVNVGGNTEEVPQADPKATIVVKEELDVGGSASFQGSKATRQPDGGSAGVKSGWENPIEIDSSDDDDNNTYISQRTQVEKVETHKRKVIS